MADPIVGIVLAAGASSRLGRPKQLEPMAGKPLVAHTVERMQASGVDSVLVVTGARHGDVENALTPYDIVVVRNDAYATGQASSLITGIEAASQLDADAVIIVLADQPGIAASAIDALMVARRDGAMLGMAGYGADRGHPVMFGRELFPELRAVTGDAGGRDVIRQHIQQLVVVDGGRHSLPADLDREEDLAAVSRDIREA